MLLCRRTGQRAIVNVRGDLIVRPLPLEQRVAASNWLGLGQVKDHFLSEYSKSLLRIMEVQFRGKGAPGGAQGVVALVQGCPPLRRILESQHFRLPELLRHASNSGVSALPVVFLVFSSVEHRDPQLVVVLEILPNWTAMAPR